MRTLTTLVSIVLPLWSWASAAGQSTQPTLGGNAYLAQVLKDLEYQGNLTARLRHETRLFDQKLTGSGKYWQLRTLGKRLTKWEMQTQIADQTTSFEQVYDGDYLWTDRRSPTGRQVRRLDIERLQTKLRNASRGNLLDQQQQLIAAVEGQGGFGQMLADLLRNFEFQPPQPTQLVGLPVNALIGSWRPERLVQHWPSAVELGTQEPPAWPRQLPHHVLLLIRRDNRIPCVCEYRRANDAALATSLAGLRPASDPLLRYEIFEVQTAVAIPQEKFQFSPGNEWTDETTLVLEQLTSGNNGPAAASQPAAETAAERNAQLQQR